MFTKVEIAERLLLQMQIEEAELQAQIIEAISQWSDEVLKKEVKTACGGELIRVSHNQYLIS